MTNDSYHQATPRAAQYSPSLSRDRRENIIRSLEEAVAAAPLAIAISLDKAIAILNALKDPSR
jgi:hypothetical protein